VIANGPARQRLEFTYDHLHRRVRKVVKRFPSGQSNSSTTSTFVVSKDRRFIYDGWNMVAELDASPLQPGGAVPSLELLRAYAWGNDLSGTAQGAGGVGGLLMIQERDLRAKRGGLTPQIPAVYAPIYDFNGNVLNYVELNRGEGLTHTFDYDAFGRELTQDTLIPSGDTSPPESLPIKFSTKYHDEETGLAYYGRRYYTAEMNRWINRDPIGEKGGLNLYGMVGNDAVNRVDVLGLHKGIIAGLDIEIWTNRRQNSFLGDLITGPSKIDLTSSEHLAIMPCHDDSIHIMVTNDPFSSSGMLGNNGPYVMGGADTINGRAYPTVIHSEVYMGTDPFNQPLDVKGLQLWTPFKNAMVEQVVSLDATIEVKPRMWKAGGVVDIVIRAHGGQDKTWKFHIMN
jgi:RHS repeat-associated protein